VNIVENNLLKEMMKCIDNHYSSKGIGL